MFENERWIDSFDIPLFSNTDSTLQEIEIYAYMFNVSATYIQFIIPSYDEITISIEDKLDIYLAGKIRTNLVVGESIDLVDAKHIIGNETGIIGHHQMMQYLALQLELLVMLMRQQRLY